MSKYKIEPIYDIDPDYDDVARKIIGFQVTEDLDNGVKKRLYWGNREECLRFLAKISDKN